MGWLHASPKSVVKGEIPLSRLEQKTKSGDDIEYPPCPMPSMVDYLFSAGPSIIYGGTSAPLNHQEIWAWQQNTSITLCAWEINALREMSRQYLAELLQSDKQDAPPPWIPEITEEKREKVASRIKDVLRG